MTEKCQPNCETISLYDGVHRCKRCFTEFVPKSEAQPLPPDNTDKSENIITELKKELQRYNDSFNLRWAADMRAIKRWQDETGQKLKRPDHADMVVWLLNKLEGFTGRLDEEEKNDGEQGRSS